MSELSSGIKLTAGGSPATSFLAFSPDGSGAPAFVSLAGFGWTKGAAAAPEAYAVDTIAQWTHAPHYFALSTLNEECVCAIMPLAP